MEAILSQITPDLFLLHAPKRILSGYFTVFIGLRRQNIQRLPLAQRNHLPAPHDCDTDISCHRIIQVAAIYKHCAGAGTASALSYRSLDTLACLQKRCPEKIYRIV